MKPAVVAMCGEARGFELVAQAAHLAIGKFGLDQAIQPGFGLHRPARSLGEQLVPGCGHAVKMQSVQLRQPVNGRHGRGRQGRG
jgi:hypothetical protein